MDIYVTYGRMNPPTTGHIKLVHEMLQMAHKTGGRVVVVVSHSLMNKEKMKKINDKSKITSVSEKKKGFENPLSARQKILHLRHAFNVKKINERFGGKRVPISFKQSSGKKSIYKIVSELSNKYPSSKIHFVVGEDRKNDFKSLTKYGVHRILAVKRPKKADTASATKARTHAVRGEAEAFLRVMRGAKDTNNAMLKLIQKNAQTNKKVLQIMRKIRTAYSLQKP